METHGDRDRYKFQRSKRCPVILQLGYVMSRLSVQQEVGDAYALDSVLVGGREWVECEQVLRVAVADGEERREFAVESGFFERGERDLEVGRGAVFHRDEIDFLVAEDADVDLGIATPEFEVNDVLENASAVGVSGAEERPPQSHVGEIVFGVDFEVLPSAYIVTIDAGEQEGFAQSLKVGVEGGVRNFDSVRLERADDFVDGEQIADVVEQKTCEPFQDGGVAEAVAGEHVFVEDGFKDSPEIIALGMGIVGEQRGKGESAVLHVVGEDFAGGAVRGDGEVFGEAERLKLDLDVASGQESGEFAGEELGVGAGDVNIEFFGGVNSVHEPFEVRNVLHFVQEDVGLERRMHSRLDVVPSVLPMCELWSVRFLEIEREDLFRGDSFGQQLLAVELEKGRLAAPADTGYDFDNVLVTPGRKPVREEFALDFAVIHRNTPSDCELFTGMIAKNQIGVNGDLLVCYKNGNDFK